MISHRYPATMAWIWIGTMLSVLAMDSLFFGEGAYGARFCGITFLVATLASVLLTKPGD